MFLINSYDLVLTVLKEAGVGGAEGQRFELKISSCARLGCALEQFLGFLHSSCFKGRKLCALLNDVAG